MTAQDCNIETVSETPSALSLPDGSTLLYQRHGDSLHLSIPDTDMAAKLSGTLASRLSAFLLSLDPDTFPPLGPLARQHPWLQDIKHAHRAFSPASLLLGGGLGMLFIELTDRCNESCIHCYAESAPERSAKLNRNEIQRVLQQVCELDDSPDRPAVQFTGGDPLIHPDLCFAVQSARQLGYDAVEIYTNGLALTTPLLERLLPYKPAFAFSIYSSDAAIHDHITRVPGSLERTIKAIRRVQASGLALRIGIILMQENRHSAEQTAAFMQQELGIDAAQIGFDVVRSTGRGAFMDDVKIPHLPRGSHKPDMPETSPGTPAKRNRHGKLCISPEGDVFPCIFSRRVKLGNIRKQSLGSIISELAQRRLAGPSAQRWQQCRESLSCSDCQTIAYLLADKQPDIPIRNGALDATA